MKKGILLVMFALLSAGLMQAKDRVIKTSDLPKAAQAFINTHFSNQNISYVYEDSEFNDTEYKAVFADGTKVEFNKKGVWTDLECRQTSVPSGILPSAIDSYVKSSFSGTKIIKAEKDMYGYEVTLSNGIELKFNSKGKFVRFDD